MKFKKVLRNGVILFLVIGASLTLGFLSFGGMFALWPILPLALGAFVLSTAYEGEIYFQNIKSALNKLFQTNYLKRYMSNQFLREHFPNTQEENCPQFFKDYEQQMLRLDALKKEIKESKKDPSLKRLIKTKKEHLKKILRDLQDMERWFSLQAFGAEKEPQTNYQRQLLEWLKTNAHVLKLQADYNKRYYIFQGVKAFSIVAGIFMGLATSYLFAQTISTIPLLAVLMASTVFGGPMVGIICVFLVSAGIAYGLLTYNAVTDLINNNSLFRWYENLKNHLSEGLTWGNALRVAAAVLLTGLAIALTLFTAGTWWTVAKTAAPLFSWMIKIPGLFMTIINPIILGLAAGAFNISNTYETYETLDALTANKNKNAESSKTKETLGFWKGLSHAFSKLTKNENIVQKMNPFRILLKLTLTPLRILLFLGHLASIGANADRVPGIHKFITALLGVISEGFEDLHYFPELINAIKGIFHTHSAHGGKDSDITALLEKRHGGHSGHHHHNGIPTQALKIIFSPLYLLAIGWDWAAGQFNEGSRKGFIETCIQYELFIFDYIPGFKKNAWSMPALIEEASPRVEEEAPSSSEDLLLEKSTVESSLGQWQKEQAIYKIEGFERKHFKNTLINRALVDDKRKGLAELKSELAATDSVEKTLGLAQNKLEFTIPRYGRFFTKSGTTATAKFISELPAYVGVRAA